MDPPQSPPPPGARRPPGEHRSLPFTGREVLGSSFSIFLRHLPILVALAAVFHALPTFLRFQQPDTRLQVDENAWLYPWPGGWIGLATMLADLLLPLGFQAVVTLAVFRTLRGGPPRYGESFLRGVQRLHLAFGSGLVVWLALYVPVLLLVFLGRGLWASGGVLIGGVIWLAYAAIMACVWFVSVQAAVVEKASPLASLSRSAALTRGFRGAIFGLLLVIFGVPGAIRGIVETVVLPPEVEGVLDPPRILLTAGFDVLFAGLQAVAAVVIYHALRRAKEGVGLDELLAVFD